MIWSEDGVEVVGADHVIAEIYFDSDTGYVLLDSSRRGRWQGHPRVGSAVVALRVQSFGQLSLRDTAGSSKSKVININEKIVTWDDMKFLPRVVQGNWHGRRQIDIRIYLGYVVGEAVGQAFVVAALEFGVSFGFVPAKQQSTDHQQQQHRYTSCYRYDYVEVEFFLIFWKYIFHYLLFAVSCVPIVNGIFRRILDYSVSLAIVNNE